VPVELFPIEQFALRFKKILLAKKETNLVLKGDGAVYLESATNMTSIKDTSIDYIFTDPPYGSFIKYIKLSTMWNSWLGFTVPEDLAQKEVIAQNNNDQQYFELLKQSAKECYRVLKEGSYLSLVFSHRDLSYWRKIYNIFADAGFNYKISVPQPLKTVWSLHKKQNDLSSFAGEVIITFKKEALSNNRKTQSLKDIIDNLFSFDETLSTDELCLNLIPKLYESGILDEIGNKKIILSDFLKGHLIYNAEQKSWQKTH
jgi:adenine-specific DNA methylase